MLWKFVFTLTPNPIYNETAKNKISCCKETTAYFICVGMRRLERPTPTSRT